MRAGIIGFGKMGMLHTGILNTIEDVQVVSIAEKEGFLTKYVKNALPKINVYGDYETMMKEENLDIVYVTTPPLSHIPIAEKCVKQGINFFIEKPLTVNLAETKKIYSQIKNADIIHAVGYNLRFLETFAKAKSILDQNILGNISSIKSTFYVSNIFSKPAGWRFKQETSGGGVLLELGCHLVDLLLWYCGSINKVSGEVKSLYSSVDDVADMKMEFSNGIQGTLSTSWSIEGYRIAETSMEITGSNGNLVVNQDYIKIELKEPRANFHEKKTQIYKQSLDGGVPFDVAGTDYAREDRNFVECVKNKKRPMVDVIEASRTQSVIQAMYDAAKLGSMREVEYIE